MDVIRNWFRRYFNDPQVIILAVLLLLGFAVILFMGDMLAPVLASVVLAYLLEGLVVRLERWHLPRLLAVSVVVAGFLLLLVLILFGMVPALSNQLTQLFQQLPVMISEGQALLQHLPEEYPAFITEQQVDEIMAGLRREITSLGQQVFSVSLASVFNIIAVLVYVILVPVLVFFFLKDKERIFSWIAGYLPHERGLSTRVWRDVNAQIANYVRGKVWEILIVGGVSFITFSFMGLQYALLLATLVGLSVIIPYIGAAVVTIPIALVAYFQWGWGAQFAYVMIAYGVIQALDGNVLVPLLFSEVVDLHPIAIIVAVLVFGGIWGLWGLFFAIPLATLVQAVLKAWPRHDVVPKQPAPEMPARDGAES
ncbi:MAG TPA: AI-2E family transporter [Gammaproteobacteria bacterium]|nr:AI-2E family transporter [Gammaproteobacteria bacterium]